MTERYSVDGRIVPTINGGAGSGNFGHAGRPGEVGGSAPSGQGGGTGYQESNAKEKARVAKYHKEHGYPVIGEDFSKNLWKRTTELGFRIIPGPVYHIGRGYVVDLLYDNPYTMHAFHARYQAENFKAGAERASEAPDNRRVKVTELHDDFGKFAGYGAIYEDDDDRNISKALKKAYRPKSGATLEFWASGYNAAIREREKMATKWASKKTNAFALEQSDKTLNGGKGSGNFGHAGRLGEVGGSAPTGTSVSKSQPSKTDRSSSITKDYQEKYPDDELGKELKDVSYDDILENLSQGNGDKFYDVLGEADSTIRERIFEMVADKVGVKYDDVYDAWQGTSYELRDAITQSPRAYELEKKEKKFYSVWRDDEKAAAKARLTDKEQDERNLRSMVSSVWAYDGSKSDNKYLNGDDRYTALSKKEKQKIIDEEWDYLDTHCIHPFAGTDSEGVSYNTITYAPSKAKKKQEIRKEQQKPTSTGYLDELPPAFVKL